MHPFHDKRSGFTEISLKFVFYFGYWGLETKFLLLALYIVLLNFAPFPGIRRSALYFKKRCYCPLVCFSCIVQSKNCMNYVNFWTQFFRIASKVALNEMLAPQILEIERKKLPSTLAGPVNFTPFDPTFARNRKETTFLITGWWDTGLSRKVALLSIKGLSW